MFYRLLTGVCCMAVCVQVICSAAMKEMKAQNKELVQTPDSAVEPKQSNNQLEQHSTYNSDLDPEFDRWLFKYLNTHIPSKALSRITTDKRFGFMGSRGKKSSYGFMGSRGKKRGYGFMGSRGKKRGHGFMGSRGKKSSYGFMGSRGKKSSYGFMGSRGKKSSYGFMGSRGKKRGYGFMGSRGKKRGYGFMGSRGKKSNDDLTDFEDEESFGTDITGNTFGLNTLTDGYQDESGYTSNDKRAPHFGFHGVRG
ncbi:otolin-1-like [Gigantopelta aegis]|uniref:otolin-1-like n=1 Tax=Gigantopelta aegis TaxID=1735272 RepID=UPI001B88A3D4|nr:otolin-1-like [Gigantopelta aegis]